MDPIYLELQTNAFLKLADIKNSQDLMDEFNKLTLELTPYTVEVNGKQYTPLDLDVASLIDTNEDPSFGASGYGIIGDYSKSQIVETTLAKQVPKTMDLIYKLFGKAWIRRVKISKLPPNSNMLLHRHPYLDRPNCNNEVVIHIPLQTNPGVLAVVSKDGQLGDAKKHHFTVGGVWYLNTFYHHKFENNGTEDRYHLWINLVWRDGECGVNQEFANLVQKQLPQGIKL
jgi:hypothetical protein